MRRFRGAEAGDLPVFDEDVVQRQEQLAVDGRPVVRLGRDDMDVPVQPHLLAVVLADVRVVPVRAGIGNVHLVGERLPDGNRRLRVMCPVVAVLEPQAVPVHGCLEVALVRDLDRHGRAFGNLERRPGIEPL